MNGGDRYVRLEELVAYSSLSEKLLRRLTQDPAHPLPVYRVGRLTLYKLSEFDQWLRENEERAGPRPVDTAYRTALLIRGHRR